MQSVATNPRKRLVQPFSWNEGRFDLLDINTSLVKENDPVISTMEFIVAITALSKIELITTLNVSNLRKCPQKDYPVQKKGRYLFVRLMQETTTVEPATVGRFLGIGHITVYTLRNNQILKHQYIKDYRDLFNHVQAIVLEQEHEFQIMNFADGRVFKKFKEKI